jgi:hypothetical protein
LKLPDGRDFLSWKPVLRFTRTYHVDCGAAGASDTNPGTRDRPFHTIGRAAAVLKPGERVLVWPGVYRERVTPARGGASPSRMISYQAAPGGSVIVRGSEVVTGPWRRESPSGAGAVWRVDLGQLLAGIPADENPFRRQNLERSQLDIMSWAVPQYGKLPFRLPCGLVFQDDRRLVQVASREELSKATGVYWVDGKRCGLFVRTFGDSDPRHCRIEVTTRQYVFAPRKMGLRYIHVRGFIFEHAGNPFPMPQYGALSTTRGSRWLIEDNVVRQVNSIGIDIANQHMSLPQPRSKPQGHIVRRNQVSACGISGLQGLASIRCLIEDNTFADNAFHDAERMFESAGIKTHMNRDTLIRNNLVLRTAHGSGIWIDAGNRNTRVTGNTVVDTRTEFGGIFVEISDRTNSVDGNVVWATRGAGIYEHDTENQVFRGNVIGRSTGPALWLRGSVTGRKLGKRPLTGGNHIVVDNILYANGRGIVTPNAQKLLARNVSDGVTVRFDRRKMTAVVERARTRAIR